VAAPAEKKTDAGAVQKALLRNAHERSIRGSFPVVKERRQVLLHELMTSDALLKALLMAPLRKPIAASSIITISATMIAYSDNSTPASSARNLFSNRLMTLSSKSG